MTEYTLHQGDSLKIMQELKNECEIFDSIITDPPYNVSVDNNFKTMGRGGIDFGDWDKNFDQKEWIKHCSSLIKNGGNIVIFNSWKNLSHVVEALEENGFIVKDMLRWVKNNPMPRNRDRRFIVDYEVAIWAVKKGGKWVFNRQNETYDRPEIKCSITSKNEKKGLNHPTQKPIEVMQWIIKTLTNENDVIFDPFSGTGATGIAALMEKRKFVGIEKDERYFNEMSERFSQLQN